MGFPFVLGSSFNSISFKIIALHSFPPARACIKPHFHSRSMLQKHGSFPSAGGSTNASSGS